MGFLRKFLVSKICLLHFFLRMILLIFKPFLQSINLLYDKIKVFVNNLQRSIIKMKLDFKNLNHWKNCFVVLQIMMSDFVIKVIANFIDQIIRIQLVDFNLVIDLPHHRINFLKYFKFNYPIKCFNLSKFVLQIKIINFIDLYFQIKIHQLQVKLNQQIKSQFMLKVKYLKSFQKVLCQQHYQIEIQFLELLDLFIKLKHRQISYFNRLIPIDSQFIEGQINLFINQTNQFFIINQS